MALVGNMTMALVGNMTFEELALFYFQKEIVPDFTIL
jgi:hypothetical protein